MCINISTIIDLDIYFHCCTQSHPNVNSLTAKLLVMLLFSLRSAAGNVSIKQQVASHVITVIRGGEGLNLVTDRINLLKRLTIIVDYPTHGTVA